MTTAGETMHAAPNPFSREGSRPEDGLGADFAGFGAPTPPPPPPPLPAPPVTPPMQPPAYPDPAAQQGFGKQAPASFNPYPSHPMAQAYGYPYAPAWPARRQASPYATASLIAGLASLFLFISGPVAIGLGIAGLRHAQREPETIEGSGLAVGGIVTGVIGSLMLALIVFAMVMSGQ